MAQATMGIPRTGDYQPMDFTALVGAGGLSKDLWTTHLKLYEGYVTHTNKALDLLRGGTLDPYAAGEVRRRFGWEFNGMRLHELFFGNLTRKEEPLARDAPLRAAITNEWGSFEAWQKRFVAIGEMRGIGWAALVHDPAGDRFLNTWVNEHDTAAFAGATPVLLMDLFEHAYIQDFGTDKASYVEGIQAAFDWNVVEKRWRDSRRPKASLAGA